METLEDRIQLAMSYRGLRQGELARSAGISAQYLSDITHGRKQASKRLMYDIARALRVSPEWLLDGQGPMEQVGNMGGSDAALLASEIINAPPESKRRAFAVAIAKLTDREIDALDRFVEVYIDVRGPHDA